MKYIKAVILILLFTTLIHSQDDSEEISEDCSANLDCSDCLADSECKFCSGSSSDTSGGNATEGSCIKKDSPCTSGEELTTCPPSEDQDCSDYNDCSSCVTDARCKFCSGSNNTDSDDGECVLKNNSCSAGNDITICPPIPGVYKTCNDCLSNNFTWCNFLVNDTETWACVTNDNCSAPAKSETSCKPTCVPIPSKNISICGFPEGYQILSGDYYKLNFDLCTNTSDSEICDFESDDCKKEFLNHPKCFEIFMKIACGTECLRCDDNVFMERPLCNSVCKDIVSACSGISSECLPIDPSDNITRAELCHDGDDENCHSFEGITISKSVSEICGS